MVLKHLVSGRTLLACGRARRIRPHHRLRAMEREAPYRAWLGVTLLTHFDAAAHLRLTLVVFRDLGGGALWLGCLAMSPFAGDAPQFAGNKQSSGGPTNTVPLPFRILRRPGRSWQFSGAGRPKIQNATATLGDATRPLASNWKEKYRLGLMLVQDGLFVSILC